MWLVFLLVLAAIVAFGWLAYKHGLKAAVAAIVALASAIGAAALEFYDKF